MTGSTHGLSAEDIDVQARARLLADELIPYEVEAELNDGEIDPAVLEKQHQRVHELGLGAANIPVEHGGLGLSFLQQVLIQEQANRVTNALGWIVYTPPLWFTEVATPAQRERWLAPTVRGELHECYAITEEGAGSDVDAIEATARRDGDSFVLDGVKWHVTSYNGAGYCFFQAKLTEGPHAGEHAMFVVDLPSPACASCATRRTRTPSATTTPWSRSRGCGCRRTRSSAPRATGWASRTRGSATSD